MQSVLIWLLSTAARQLLQVQAIAQMLTGFLCNPKQAANTPAETAGQSDMVKNRSLQGDCHSLHSIACWYGAP